MGPGLFGQLPFVMITIKNSSYVETFFNQEETSAGRLECTG